MDVHAHQPEEEFADFTENELLSLIDAGTAGAYSEIYRRYRDDVVARASSSLPPAKARQITDDAFLSVLRSLLNRSADTAEGLRSLVDSTVDEHIAHSTPPHGSHSHDEDFPGDAGAPEAALVSQALSTLPDNWQRILWLGEVDRLSPEAVADRLNIRASTVERLAGRARQGLKDEWRRIRPTNSKATADHRSALIPALLTSPIVIERLSDTLAQAVPEPAPTDGDSPFFETAALGMSPVERPETETAAAIAADEPAARSFVVATGTDSAGTTSEPAAAPGTESDLAAVTAAGASAGTAGASAGTAGNSAAATGSSSGGTEDTNTVEPAALTVFGAHPAAADTLTQAPASAGFRMPKPVLIPVVAACIGLLGTLVGVAIVPQHSEQTGFRPGSASTEVSPADSSSEQGDKRSTSHSPDDTNSGEPGQRSGSEKSKASDSGRDGNEKSPRSPGHDDDRSHKGSSAAENPGDDADNSSRDNPSASEPGDPRPSDSDKSDPKSPSEPTPSAPDDPESPPEPSPSQPDEPTPTDPPATDPPPEEPTDPTPPPEEPSPSEEPPPSDTGAPAAPDPTEDDSSSAPSTSN